MGKNKTSKPKPSPRVVLLVLVLWQCFCLPRGLLPFMFFYLQLLLCALSLSPSLSLYISAADTFTPLTFLIFLQDRQKEMAIIAVSAPRGARFSCFNTNPLPQVMIPFLIFCSFNVQFIDSSVSYMISPCCLVLINCCLFQKLPIASRRSSKLNCRPRGFTPFARYAQTQQDLFSSRLQGICAYQT